MVDLRGRMGWILAQVLVAICIGMAPAVAQTLPLKSPEAPPLTSNRPGISESEALLVPRTFQLESGLTFASFSDAVVRHRQLDLPEATVRVGVTERFEVFANLPSYFWEHASLGDFAGNANGASDLSANVKLGWLSEAQHGITMNAAIGLSFPVGSNAFSSGGYDPSLRLLWARSLPGDFGLAGNLAVAGVTAGSDRVIASAASVGLGHPLTDSSSWFVELFGDFVEGDAVWQFDGGAAVLVGNDYQIDLSAGRTLKSGPSAWFVGAGITIRRRR